MDEVVWWSIEEAHTITVEVLVSVAKTVDTMVLVDMDTIVVVATLITVE
jgi:hypothetical protein